MHIIPAHESAIRIFPEVIPHGPLTKHVHSIFLRQWPVLGRAVHDVFCFMNNSLGALCAACDSSSVTGALGSYSALQPKRATEYENSPGKIELLRLIGNNKDRFRLAPVRWGTSKLLGILGVRRRIYCSYPPKSGVCNLLTLMFGLNQGGICTVVKHEYFDY